MDDRLDDMICDVGAKFFVEEMYKNMSIDVETSLYPSSNNFTQLSVGLRLINLKEMNGWMDG